MSPFIRKYRSWIFIIASIAIVITVYFLGCGERTVILVRHAEKEQAGENPPLSDLGQDRAVVLAEILGSSGVSQIFTTQYLRTQQTAQPLADVLGITPESINRDASGDVYVDELTGQLLSGSSRKVMLVVSHSDTIPRLIEQLGAGEIPIIGEDDFDNLYIVTVPRWFGSPKLIRALYGASSP